jgi:hypothetical protein
VLVVAVPDGTEAMVVMEVLVVVGAVPMDIVLLI